MFSNLKKEFLFHGIALLALIQTFNLSFQEEIDFTVALILVSVIFLVLYFRLLLEIVLVRKEL